MEAEKVHKEIQGLIEDVALIKRAVIGEAKSGQVGLVRRVTSLEKRVLAWVIAAGVGGGLGSKLPALIEHLVK